MAIIKDFITRSGIILQGTAAVTSSTNQTGALQVNSGAAIAKNLIVGQSAQIYGTLNVYDQLVVSGSAQINGTLTYTNAVISGNLNVSGNSTLNSLTVTNTSVFNNTITVNGTSTYNAPVIITGANTFSVGSGQSSFSGVVNITNNTAATISGGALQVTGGAFVGSNLIVNSTNANTQTNTSNALYVAGGAWIDRTFVVSGDATFRGNVVFSGTQTNVYSTQTVYTDSLLNLHVPAGGAGTFSTTTWAVDDGRDIGFVFNYFKGTDKDAFLGWSNSSGFLEWFEDGSESNGVYSGTSFGTFRTGNIRLTGTQTAISSSTGALQVNGGIGAVNVYANANISGQTLTSRSLTQNRIVYVGSGGQLIDSGSLTFDGTTITGTITTATNSTNLLGGAVGSLPFQTATNTTVFLPIGNAGEILVVSGGRPSWTPPTGLSAGQSNTATNLAGGTSGQVPFQASPGNTSFFGPGTVGQLLQSNGTSGPTYVNTGNVFVGFATFGINVRGGAAGDIPIQSGANTTGFIPAGASNTFLRHNGTTATFVTTGTIFVGNAVTSTNIRGGAAGQLPFQSGPDATAFVSAGNAGEVLVSRGSSSGGPIFQNTLTLASTTGASSTNSGAFQVVGGVGIGQNLFVGGTANVTGITSLTNNTNASSTTTGALVITGGAGIGRDLFVGGTANVAGITSLTNNTNASSTTTGALVITGGAGIGRDLFVGGNVNVTGTITGTLNGNAATVSTVQRTTNANHFITFVDSDNSSATAESHYTTSSFTINPSNGSVTISGSLTLGSSVSGSTVNAIFSNNVLLSSYTSPALTSTSTVTLDSLSTSTYRSARYTVQVVRGLNVHITEAVIFHDNTNAYINEYGISTSAGELGTFDATVSTNNLLFTFAPNSTASTVVKVVRMALTS